MLNDPIKVLFCPERNLTISFIIFVWYNRLLGYHENAMRHLYIIGNGFDIYTGLHTRYADFRWWLENNYPFIYENMKEVYDIDAEWWNDFEVQLGLLDINKYVKKFTHPDRSDDEIIVKIERRKKFENEQGDGIPSHESHCARRLEGVLDVLQYCFEKWVKDCHRTIVNPQYLNIEKDNSFFINFNYTDVLEILYEIPEERVLHIHGRSSTHERLIFGHDKFLLTSSLDYDEEKVCFELNRYNKNPYEYIYKHPELKEILKDVEYVHILGFSFSPIDKDYIDWVFRNVTRCSQWEVSWFSEEDKNRIDKFVLEHWGLKERLNLVRLEDISKNYRNH